MEHCIKLRLRLHALKVVTSLTFNPLSSFHVQNPKQITWLPLFHQVFFLSPTSCDRKQLEGTEGVGRLKPGIEEFYEIVREF